MNRFLKTITFSAIIMAASCLGVSAETERQTCAADGCVISGANGGTYHMVLPENWDGKTALKPFVFFHGHNGSGKGVARNGGMARDLHKRGYVLIAPDGPLFNFRGRSTRGWAARPEGKNPRGNRDDIAFVEQVLADVGKRINVRADATVISGFSSGGSMAWYFACYSRTPIDAVIAVAGGLRRALPTGGKVQLDGSVATKCPSPPRKMVHIHGWTDRQVPLEGRGIRAWHQGDVFEGLAVQRNTNGCQSRPDIVEGKGPFWCRSWSQCESGVPVHMCMHAGGHGMPKGWLEQGFALMKTPKS